MRPLSRRALLSAGTALLALCGPAAAQPPPADPARFLAFAHSSAVLQQRASELAASRDTRPEAKAFARDMARFRTQQLARLQAIARERGQTLPGGEEFEHKVVLENLEPLDYLALTRRYAEIQVQALEQEVRGYEAASRSPDEGLKSLAAEMLPQLRDWLGKAQQVEAAVKA